MKAFYTVSVIVLCALMFGACCTKIDCDSFTYPQITLYYPRAIAPPALHDLTELRLDPATNAVLDSVTTGCENWCNFFPWMSSGNSADWGHYKYAVRLDKQPYDTISSIQYDLVTQPVACNSCYGGGNGNAQAISFSNISLLLNGQPLKLQSGDTIFIDR